MTPVKKFNNVLTKKAFYLFIISTCQLTFLTETFAQYPEIEDEIAKHRKGLLQIQANPGDTVIVEQLSHDFWFGGAISNGLASDNMPEEDKRMYKKKFLENFNSAVTENALKWGNMERQKGEVNYATVDAILKWTEENNIPLRGAQPLLGHC